MSLESRIPKFPKFSKFPIFPRLPKFSDKQSIKDCPLSPQIICCQSGANLPPIKILEWMGHTIMYFPFSPMIEVAKERPYHNKISCQKGSDVTVGRRLQKRSLLPVNEHFADKPNAADVPLITRNYSYQEAYVR